MVEWLFLAVPWGCLSFVIMVFPDHTHLLFLMIYILKTRASGIFLSLACKTWPKPDIHDSEIIPADLGYKILCKDRKDGYGGVMIGVKRQLVY